MHLFFPHTFKTTVIMVDLTHSNVCIIIQNQAKNRITMYNWQKQKA